MEFTAVFLFAALVVGTTIAGPSSVRPTESCSKECTRAPNPKFRYETGHTYFYDYETETITSVVGASDDKAITKLSGRVAIEVLGDCDFKLKIRNVRVEAPGLDRDKVREYQSTVASRGLPFSFDNGRIEHVCPSPTDPVWSVNIKRAILSAFQNSMHELKNDESLREVDISGNCITNYKHASAFWGGNEIIKSKLIDSCASRHGNKSRIHSHHYFTPHAGIQNVPVVKSTYMCTQHIDKYSIIDSVKCEETHQLRPFSQKENGATTRVTSKLTYDSKKKSSSRLGKVHPRQSLLFEHTDEEKETSNVRELEKVAFEICSSTKVMIKPELPELFNQLVAIMQSMSESDITTVHEKIANDNACKSSMAMSVFMDALPVAGNAGSLALLVKKIPSGHVSPSKAKSMLTGLAFHPRPTEEAIAALKPLLSSAPKVQTEAFLGISSMIHTYCHLNTDCQRSSVISDVLAKLNNHLGYKCRTKTPEETRSAIVALKSFGNIGSLGTHSSTIRGCYEHPTVPHKVRLAAIEAYRRVPCSEEETENKIKLLKRTSEDVELRIAAYLSSMRCVGELRSYNLLNDIMQMWKSEKYNQVGSFVWSHLSNLQETSSPLKAQLKYMLNRYSLKDWTPDNMLQFSRNFEWSMMNDKLNIGGELESNLIFTPKSYLPRSFMANATVNLYGYSVNMLEVGGRMEGMDHYVEKYVAAHHAGPALQSLMKKLPLTLSRKIKEIESRVRHKRSTYSKEHMLDIDRQVNEIPQEAPDGSLYVKIFGNEIKFVTFDDLKKMTPTVPKFADALKKMSEGHNFNIARSVSFANNWFSVPTISGMPLRLSVNGTSSLGARVKGNFDIKNALSSPRSINIDGTVEPSGAMLITTAMYVDTGVSRHGLKLKMNYHSSSVLSGKLYYMNGDIRVKLDTPRNVVDLLTMKSEMMMINSGKETPLKMTNLKKTDYNECFSTFNKLLGFDVCLDLSVPKPFFSRRLPYLLNGPRSFKLSLKKFDETMTGYKFSLKYLIPRRLYDDSLLKLEFDTPGSKTNRHYLFDMNTKRDDKRLNVIIKSPFMTVDAIGTLIYKNYLEKAELDITYVGSKRYLVNAEMSINRRTETMFEYQPKIRLELADETPVILDGKFEINYKDRTFHILNVDLSSSQYNSEPSRIKLMFKKEGDIHKNFSINTNGSLKFPKYKFYLDKFFSRSSDGITSKVKISHKLDDQEKNTLTFHAKVKDLSTNSLRKYNTVFGFNDALNPNRNLVARWNSQMTKQYLEHTLRLKLNKKKYSAHSSINYRLNDDNKLTFFDIQSKVTKDPKTVYDSRTIYNFRKIDDKPHLTWNSTVRFGAGKEIGSFLDVNVMSYDPVKLNSEVRLTTPNNSYIVRDEIVQKPEKNGFRGSTFVQWGSPAMFVMHSYELNIRDKTDPPKQVQLTGTIAGKGHDMYPLTYQFKRDAASSLAMYDAFVSVNNYPEYNILIRHEKGMKMINGTWNLPSTTGFIRYNKGPKVDLNLFVKEPELNLKASFMKTKDKLDSSISYDCAKDPKKQFSASANWVALPHPTNDSLKVHSVGGNVVWKNKRIFFMKAKGSESVLAGPHSIETLVKIPKKDPVRFISKYSVSRSKLLTVFDYYHAKERKAHSRLIVKVGEDRRLFADFKLMIKSAYEHLRDFEIKYEFENKRGSTDKEFEGSRTFFMRLKPGKEYNFTESVKVLVGEENGKKYATFNGNVVMMTTIEGMEKSTTSYNGRVTEDWDLIFNYQGTGFGGKSIEQSIEMSVLTNRIIFDYSIKSHQLGSVRLGLLARKSQKDWSYYEYDSYLIDNDKEYQFNISKTRATALETTTLVLKTPYESLTDFEAVRKNYIYDPSGIDIRARWNTDKVAVITLKSSYKGDTLKLDGQLSSPWFPKVKMDAKVKRNNEGMEYSLSVSSRQKQWLHLKSTRSWNSKGGRMTLLMDLNQRKLMDMQVRTTNETNKVKWIITVSGLIDEIEAQVDVTRSGKILKPSLLVCTKSKNCFAVNANIMHERNENSGELEIELGAGLQVNKQSLLSVSFSLKNKPSMISSTFDIALDPLAERKYGYDYSSNIAMHALKFQLITPSRKGHFEMTKSKASRGIDYRMSLSGKASDHALVSKLFVSTKKDQVRLEITHPSLSRPILVKYQARNQYRMFSTRTDIQFSNNEKNHLQILTSARRTNVNNTASLRIYTPKSKRINIRMQSHLSFTKQKVSMGASATWQQKDISAQPKEIYIYYQHMRPDNTFDFYYRHPGRVIDVHGFYKSQAVRRQRGAVMTADAVNNGVKQKVEAEMAFNDLWINLLVTDIANPSERYRVNAAAEDENSATIFAERYTNGQTIREVTIKIHLNSSHIVHISVHWNPMMLRKMVAYTKNKIQSMRNNWNSTKDSLKGIYEEIIDKITIISDAASKEVFEPLYEHVFEDYEEMLKEFEAGFDQLEEIYEKRIEKLKKFIGRVRDVAKARLDAALAPLKKQLESWEKKLEEKTEAGLKYFEEKYPETYEQLRNMTESASLAIVYEYARVNMIFENNGTSGVLSDMLERMSYNVSRIEFIFESYNITEKISKWASAMYDELNKVNAAFSKMYDRLAARITNSTMIKSLMETRDNWLDKLGEYKYRLKKYIEKMRNRANKEYPELVALYDNAYESVIELIASYQHYSLRKYLTIMNLASLRGAFPYDPVINVKDGFISFDAGLPYTASAIKDWTNSQRSSASESGHSFWDAYYRLKPHSNPRKWLPPFDTSASIIGSQHYLTYDKHHFDFVGKCSYILTKDFKDANLSVIAHYGKNNKISLSVVVGRNEIHISNDYKVSVNGKESDLPINMDHVTVSRRSNTVIVKSYRNEIRCDWEHDVCTVYLNGWYFGKTRGMFGRYDNEGSNDMRKPSGETVKEIYELADSWGVSSKCSTLRNYARPSETLNKDSKAYKRCIESFESDSSPMRKGFSIVKPDSYKKMCLSSSSDRSFCRVAAAYVSQCRNKEIDTEMPIECVTCDIRPQQAKVLQRGQSEKIKTDMRRKSSDVVYIIENKECNTPMMKKLLQQPPMILNRELRTQQIYSRVSVISYGGKSEPEVHTAKGKNFYSFRDMMLAMRTLYKMPRAPNNERSDAFEAIRIASEMPFQPAAAKIFILVKCTSCSDTSSISYSDIQNLLLQNGIVLHVMAPEPIVVRSGNIGKSRKMFGISANSVFSQKDISQKILTGTPSLRSIVAVPKDLCIALAQEVGGTFFTEFPLLKYSSLEKNFNLVMSRQITSTATPYECQNCECVSTFDGIGKIICTPCEMPSPLQPSNIYQTEDDLKRINKRFGSKKKNRKQ